MTAKINLEKLERELRFGPDEMWWVPVLNEHPDIHQGENLPKRVTICDETLREGEETPGVVLDIDHRLAIARKLEDIGVPEIEVGYVGAIQEHYEFSQKLKQEGTQLKLISHTRIYTKGHEWKEEINRAVDAGSDILCLLASMSETLCATTPWLPKEAVPERIAESIKYAIPLGVTPALTLVDGIRTPLDDFLRAYEAAFEAGVERVYVMDGQGVALPETAVFLVRRLREVVGEDVELSKRL
jgi:isopropylmalate/homocitrate/citramalate synthase